jgi:tetratricopeptide (TPR) repeat protein
MKKGIILTCISLLSGSIFAQKAELTSAILSYRKMDLEASKNYIDAAEEKLNNGSSLKTKDLGKFWHHKGLVYYSIYTKEKNITLLSEAAEAFKTDTELEGSTFSKKSINELVRCSISFNELGYDKYDEKDFPSALIMFEKVVEINSWNAIGKVDTSNIYNASLMAVQANNTDKAIELNQKLIDLDPSNGEYHLALIKQIGKTEDLESKFSAIKYGRLMAPNHTGLIFEEVNYYLAENNNEELLKSLETAIQAAPDNKILHFAKGSSLGSLKRYEEAKAAYAKAIEIDLDYFDAYNNLASIFLDQTAPIIDKMNALGLSQADQKKYNSYKKQRNNLYSDAKPYLEEAVRIDTTAIQVLRALKDVCYQTDDMDCWRLTNNQIKELSK